MLNHNAFVKPNIRANQSAGGNWGDYSKIYDEDAYMEEMSEEARVWRVYNDEGDRVDSEIVEGWRSTLDTLLIFAGLFSAVVATFVTQTTQSLQPDYTETAASLLTELVLIQRIAASGGNVISVPHSSLNYGSTFRPDSQQVWLNALWLVSLGLTLSVALITGLIKQWLQYYIQDVNGTPRDRALVRQFRYMGLSKYGVSPIIELMSILMNISLLLFFVGLILFSEQLTGTAGITWTLVTLTCIAFLFYLGSSLLPLFNPQCPYKTSLSSITQVFIKILFSSLREFITFCFQLPRHVSKTRFRPRVHLNKLCLHLRAQVINLRSKSRVHAINLVQFFKDLRSKSRVHAVNRAVNRDQILEDLLIQSSDSDPASKNKLLARGSGMKGAESRYIKSYQDYLEIQAISELALQSNNPTASSIALQSLGALHVRSNLKVECPKDLWDPLKRQFQECFRKLDSSEYKEYKMVVDPPICERITRSYLMLKPFCYLGWDTKNKSTSFTLGELRGKPADPSKSAKRRLLERLFYFRELDRIEALVATNTGKPEFALLHLLFSEDEHEDEHEGVIERVTSDHAENRIEISDVHKWVLSQFEKAVMTDPEWNVDDDSDMCLHLIKHLSPDKTPSFQETLMIRYLSVRFGLFGWTRPSVRTELSVCFLLILPKLARVALEDGGSMDSIAQFLSFLKKFLRQNARVKMLKNWVNVPYILSDKKLSLKPDPGAEGKEPSLSEVLDELLDLVIKLLYRVFKDGYPYPDSDPPGSISLIFDLFTLANRRGKSPNCQGTFTESLRLLLRVYVLSKDAESSRLRLRLYTLSKDVEKPIRPFSPKRVLAFFSSACEIGLKPLDDLVDCLRSNEILYGVPEDIVNTILPDPSDPLWRVNSSRVRKEKLDEFFKLVIHRQGYNVCRISCSGISWRHGVEGYACLMG